MSHSRFEYVRKFESDDKLLPNTWIVIRIDGKAFHKFSDQHQYEKPNDKRALDLMNDCALNVMQNYQDIILSYGQSDEFSFIFRKDCQLYSRRASKVGSMELKGLQILTFIPPDHVQCGQPLLLLLCLQLEQVLSRHGFEASANV